MKNIAVKRICLNCLAVLCLIGNSAYAAIWQVDSTINRSISSSDGSRFIADDTELRLFLNKVPGELSGQSLKITLPMPDGSLASYRIFESSIMQPGLAAKFPDIRSFVVKGIDHPGSYGRVDISHKGFRAMIYTPYGRVFIDPDGGNQYLSRSVGRHNHSHGEGAQCAVYDLPENNQSFLRGFSRSNSLPGRVSGRITSYRLAVSATPEYVTAVGGTLSDAIAEINTAINRVNQIYERDLGIKFFLVNNNDRLIDVNGDANFNNASGPLLLGQNQAWVDSIIGSTSYDIGHIFSTGGGGVARLQSVCSAAKAQGVTGLPNPTGDTFYIDFVSHEIGHQFGGNHSYNGSEGSCGGQRNPSTAFEPGSGSTIMGYAGICAGENLQTASEATFHAGTIAEINAFVANPITGGSCAVVLPTLPVNTDPASADAGTDRTIPMGTAFSLIGSATDADGDTLSYQWDQLDIGTAPTTGTTFNLDQGNNPLYRSYQPQTVAERHFPRLDNQLGLTSITAEIIPTMARTLNFRMTARDCKSGQATDDVSVTIDAGSGPFEITSQGAGTAPFAGTIQQTVTWNTANTELAPVNCANVDIDLLTFSNDKSTFGVTSLATSVANDGSEMVTIGDRSASNARIRLSCSDNVFYDISDADLSITGAVPLATSGNTTALSNAAICGASNVDGVPPGLDGISGGGGGSGGGGSPHPLWILFLAGLMGSCRLLKCRV